jgi:hypothetical protein
MIIQTIFHTNDQKFNPEIHEILNENGEWLSTHNIEQHQVMKCVEVKDTPLHSGYAHPISKTKIYIVQLEVDGHKITRIMRKVTA